MARIEGTYRDGGKQLLRGAGVASHPPFYTDLLKSSQITEFLKGNYGKGCKNIRETGGILEKSPSQGGVQGICQWRGPAGAGVLVSPRLHGASEHAMACIMGTRQVRLRRAKREGAAFRPRRAGRPLTRDAVPGKPEGR
eukprot:2545770-Rhodomonas_salina.2